MDARSALPPGTIDEKNLLANYQAALLSSLNNGQQSSSSSQMAMMAAAAAAAAAAANSGYSGPSGSGPSNTNINPGPSPQHQQQHISMLNQAQYMANMLQQNDTFNVIQNSLASGVPTLHIPTILSYLGYNNTFPPQNNGSSSSNSSKNNKNNNLEVKYSKLMEVVQEIGRDVRPLYTGSKTASDRLRRQINQARILLRECLNEVDNRSQRGQN